LSYLETCTGKLYNKFMAIQTSYTQARAQFAELLDTVINDAETVIVERRGQESVAMIALSELERMRETLYILRSSENARLIAESAKRAIKRQGKRSSPAALRQELGLEEA
jgi:antitoxin YefM